MLTTRRDPNGLDVIDSIPRLLFYTWFSVFAALAMMCSYVVILGRTFEETTVNTSQTTHLAAPEENTVQTTPTSEELVERGRAVLRGKTAKASLRWR